MFFGCRLLQCLVFFVFLSNLPVIFSFSIRDYGINSFFNSLGLMTRSIEIKEIPKKSNDNFPSVSVVHNNNKKNAIKPIFLCEDIVKNIYNKYKTNTLYGETITKENECIIYKETPTQYEECQRLIASHDLIYILMKYNMKEKDVCNIIGLDGEQENDDITGLIYKEDRLACQVCQFTGTYIEKMIHYDPQVSTELISSGVEMICQLALVSNRNKCVEIVQHVPEIMKAYQTNPNTQTVLTSCIHANICPAKSIRSSKTVVTAIANDNNNNNNNNNNSSVININDFNPPPPSPPYCNFCKNIVSMIEKAVQKDEETYEMISNAISIMCSYMPADSSCHILVDKLEMIVQWIRQGTVPDHICMQLNFCTISPPALAPANYTVPVDNTSIALNSANKLSCILCEYVADAVQVAVLYDRQALPSIKDGIENLCQYLPPFFECSVMIKNFEEVVDMFDKGKQPNEVCDAIQMCEPEESLFIATFLKEKGLNGLHQYSALKSKETSHLNANLLTDLIFSDKDQK